MRFITVALVVLLLVALTYATSEKKRLPCARTCMVNALESDSKSAKKEFPKCLRTCLAKSSITKDDTAALLKKVEKLKNLLVKENVQEAVAELKEEAEVESDSTLAAGATLQATTGLKVRSGPCTDKKVLTTLASGATVKFTGAVQNQCGYTWYGVSGSFGSGFAASNFLKAASSGSTGGSTCRTRTYPAYKQCDSRWGGASLGSSSVCKIGCLMSSVSMALNGLGKTINGQSPNPGSLNAYLRSNGGYSGNLFIWGSVARFGLKYEGQITSQTDIKNAICANKVVVLNVNRGGHWVLATGVSGSSYTVNDPGFDKSEYPQGEVVKAGIYSS